MPSHWYDNAVFYGVDVARFYDSNGDGTGDLPGVAAKLDYVQELGVTCLWLLPFFPSPRRDNGYDITDYCAVDERFGTLEDFGKLVEAAHRRGLKIITDLVLHHTSDEHPWFREALENPRSRYHDYYIWDEKPTQEPPSSNVFPEAAPEGVWHYNDEAGKFYHHQFYRFQPDLNLANPEVMEEIRHIMKFWLGQGVDGFRIDAATHLFEQKGLKRGALGTSAYLEQLHAFAEEPGRDVLLVGEADVTAENIGSYVGENRLAKIYNFLMNNSLFLALARRSAEPVMARLGHQAQMLDARRLFNFARNFDEIDLDQLSEPERQEVYDAFAPEETMRIYGRGIRRQLAPMLESEARLKMAYSLLFSLPGTPMITCGSELAVGDDLAKPGRKAVRLPMPWEKAGGEARGLVDFFKSLIALRLANPRIGMKYPEIVIMHSASVITLKYDNILTYHNLSDKPVKVKSEGYGLVFGGLENGILPGYGYCWLERKET